MKNKDINWYDNKIQDIKERKRKLHLLQDPELKKKIRKDLKREQRAAKRSMKNNLKQYIKAEIDKYDGN